MVRESLVERFAIKYKGESIVPKRARSLVPIFAVAVCALALPSMASASTLYVSPSTPGAPFNSCAHPNYSSIQAASAAPSTAITVCPGTYVEQVQITKAVNITAQPGAILKLPASPVNSTTPCDTAIEAPHQPNQDELSICTGGTVSITGLKIEALWPAGTCYDSLYGVFVAGGATLNATKRHDCRRRRQPDQRLSGRRCG